MLNLDSNAQAKMGAASNHMMTPQQQQLPTSLFELTNENTGGENQKDSMLPLSNILESQS